MQLVHHLLCTTAHVLCMDSALGDLLDICQTNAAKLKLYSAVHLLRVAFSTLTAEAIRCIVLTWQGSASFSGLNCPAGRQLQAGEIITWSSSESWQGDDTGDQHAVENGGLPRSKTAHVMGGGWELCFEPEVRPAGRRLGNGAYYEIKSVEHR